MLSNRKIKSIANKMDSLNNQIKRLVSEIENSGHPNASKMADTLRENGYDNPARALDCVKDLLPRSGLTKRAADLPKARVMDHLETAAALRKAVDAIVSANR